MKNLVRGLISLSYTDREINEFDDFFLFFAVFWQLKVEIEFESNFKHNYRFIVCSITI